MSEIPEDIMKAANEAWDAIPLLYRASAVEAIAKAILAERRKGDKSADEGYLTGVSDAYALAKRSGFQDFADLLLKDTNKKAQRSGLPKLKVPA